MANKKKYLSDDEARMLGIEPNKKQKGKKKSLYRLSPLKLKELADIRNENFEGDTADTTLNGVDNRRISPDKKMKKPVMLPAWRDGKLMNIDEYCRYHNIDRDSLASWKLVTHTGTPYYNMFHKPYVDTEKAQREIDFEGIIKNILGRDVYTTSRTERDFVADGFDRAVYTDVHIAMETNKNGHSLYGGVWNETEIFKRLDIFIEHIKRKQIHGVLSVDELGDFMDGWNALTTRGGHELPQNMDNEKAFDVGLTFKTRLADSVCSIYDQVIFNNVCNDNHSGAFGYVVNSAFKTVSEHRNINARVFNQRKFMDFYLLGNRCFVNTHGKDDKALKFGFKPFLDAKQIEKIKDFIDHNFLMKQGRIIEFNKGDSHQFLFDETTSDAFGYFNFPAFSPASEWVQTNFKKGKSGFVTFNYHNDGGKSIHPHFFNWKK